MPTQSQHEAVSRADPSHRKSSGRSPLRPTCLAGQNRKSWQQALSIGREKGDRLLFLDLSPHRRVPSVMPRIPHQQPVPYWIVTVRLILCSITRSPTAHESMTLALYFPEDQALARSRSASPKNCRIHRTDGVVARRSSQLCPYPDCAAAASAGVSWCWM